MERRSIVIRGIVQGVGFRPFVYNLARRLRLHGFVRNQTGSVLIEVEGESAVLELFLVELADKAPPLAQVDHLSWQQQPPRGEAEFRIDASEAEASGPVFVSPDVATCDDCLRELLDPADRRYRYPFLNCTNCGPRLTIIRGTPYDRERTTMAGFPICPACRAEYEDPADRRFHAQPTACPVCGPRLSLLGPAGETLAGDPLAVFVNALQSGKIGAMKGLGGYHLVCDASNQSAVRELRRRKHRDEKPFAVMVADIAGAEALCTVGFTERTLLQSPARPIVLLQKRDPCKVADAVAPGNPSLGVMLPYTPLHHLLLRGGGRSPLVMTSGNRSDEPIVYREDEAVRRLTGIADLFLVHDRPIHVRCDDSVTRVVGEKELPIRRSRGYAPRPVPLPVMCSSPILAVGGQLKATFALARDRKAFLSHHLGDLDHYEAYRAFLTDIALYEELFEVRPVLLAHDLHPDYASSRYALERAGREGQKTLAVQHHHAHMASCMAEHGLEGPVIGVSFDGTGYGTDGAVWGGEFLVGDYQHFRRAAHLRYVPMPGGERAIREPWRMALAHLEDAGLDKSPLEARISATELQAVGKLLERGFNSPSTSSAGRLFDAVASLAGVRDRVSYEGQAAVELEWLATGERADGSYPFELTWTTPLFHPPPRFGEGDGRVGSLDTRPLIHAVADDASRGIKPAVIARRFHSTVVAMIATVCKQIRRETGLATVVLSGGVFLNALLTREVSEHLRAEGFTVYRHHLVPPNDGGLSLGQLAIAACRRVSP
jgi:hydrogenase maturation protein HypF